MECDPREKGEGKRTILNRYSQNFYTKQKKNKKFNKIIVFPYGNKVYIQSLTLRRKHFHYQPFKLQRLPLTRALEGFFLSVET